MEITIKEVFSMLRQVAKVNIVKMMCIILVSLKIIWLMDRDSRRDKIISFKGHFRMVRK